MADNTPKRSSSKEKENSTTELRTPPKFSQQRTLKLQARDARDKVLKERAQAAEIAFETEPNSLRTFDYDAQESKNFSLENERLASSLQNYNTSHESSWLQFMKWVPWNQSTLLDKDGYAVPNTGQGSSDPAWKTPERIKSPDNDMFFTPAAKSVYSNSFRQTLTPDKSLITQIDEDFQKKLAVETTKISIATRKTIQGLDEIEKLLGEGNEKSWKSPMKRPIMEIPSFSGVRQSHPVTKDYAENKITLSGAVRSDDEETLDGVSPLHSEAAPVPQKNDKGIAPSHLPKILGAQIQAEINYVETSNRLSEKLDQVEDILNTSMGQRIEANLDAMLNEIELFDHSLPRMDLTPKHRYQPKNMATCSPVKKLQKNVQFKGAERVQAYQNYCKSLQEFQNVMKRFINQQKKVHDITNPTPAGGVYENVVETYGVEFKTELFHKKSQAKEMLENMEMPDDDFISWSKTQRREIERKTKFYVLIWQDIGKFIIKYDIPAPTTVMQSKTAKTNNNEWNISVPEEKEDFPVSPIITQNSVSDQEMLSEKRSERSFKEQLPISLVQKIDAQEPEEDLSDALPVLPTSSNSPQEINKEASIEPVTDLIAFEETSPIETEEISPLEESEDDFLLGNDLPQSKMEEVIEETKESENEKAEESPLFFAAEASLDQSISSRSLRQIEAASPAQYFQSPRTPSNIPLLDLSTLHSSGRVSIDANDLLKEEENLDDFLNRSSRKDTSQRYKLDVSLLNDSSQIEEVPIEKESPKRDHFNESFPKSPISPQRSISPIVSADIFKDRPTISDLNLTEEELLEDVKKPESVLNFTISAAVNEYEKNLEEEEIKWQLFLERSNAYKMTMINECIDLVWKVKEMDGVIDWKNQSLIELMDNYKPSIQFTDEDKQNMYSSEWYGTLCDVFTLAGEIFPINGSGRQPIIYSPKAPEDLSKENFTGICREQLLKKRKTNYVENLSKDYAWDSDPARRNAHEMVTEVHSTYLRKEIYEHTKVFIERKSWDAADKMLSSHVDSILNEARKSLGRDSIVSQIDVNEL